jgi:hypothetical protein
MSYVSWFNKHIEYFLVELLLYDYVNDYVWWIDALKSIYM